MKGKYSKALIALIIILNVLFTATCLFAFVKVGSEPVALIAAWFSFTTGELWLMASIKKSKVKKGDHKNESDQLETKTDK